MKKNVMMILALVLMVVLSMFNTVVGFVSAFLITGYISYNVITKTQMNKYFKALVVGTTLLLTVMGLGYLPEQVRENKEMNNPNSARYKYECIDEDEYRYYKLIKDTCKGTTDTIYKK